MTNTTNANEEMQKVASRLKLSAAELDGMVKIGASAADLKVIETELAPLFAKRDAAVLGSEEEDEAAEEILRVVLSREDA
jgi:hypothetical protein